MFRSLLGRSPEFTLKINVSQKLKARIKETLSNFAKIYSPAEALINILTNQRTGILVPKLVLQFAGQPKYFHLV